MAVQIDKAGRDDQILGIENFRALGTLRELAVRRNRGDAISIEQDVARRIRAARGIEHASIANQQHEKNPFPEARPRRRRSSGRATPCERPVRW